MSDRFRVTVEDLSTGEKQCMEVSAGDYMFIPFAPCYLANTQVYTLKGTIVLTVKDHRPQDRAKVIDLSPSTPEEPT